MRDSSLPAIEGEFNPFFSFLSAMRLILNKLKIERKLWLIDERKDDGFNALHLACLNNHQELVKLLISDSNINLKNSIQQTSLHLAVERQHFEIIKILIENKCNMNSPDKDGDTPLHAILRHHTVLYLRDLQQKEDVVSPPLPRNPTLLISFFFFFYLKD